ncbi:MAG TPA: hypothetical protein VHX44_00535, partial [Planctomycetota bacterium]|nr:hypothetical protein [Planctomycetota bacterium]
HDLRNRRVTRDAYVVLVEEIVSHHVPELFVRQLARQECRERSSGIERDAVSAIQGSPAGIVEGHHRQGCLIASLGGV